LIIGIGGKLGSGKDVIATRLRHGWGFEVVPFAAALKEEVLQRLPQTLRAIHHLTCSAHTTMTVQSCIERMVWTTKPQGIRELLQEYGSDVRRADSVTYWTDRWRERVAERAHVVAPDVRFPNEAEAVRAAGGLLWRIERPGTVRGTHACETVMDSWNQWDAVIQNDGTIDDLWAKVDALAERLSVGVRVG